MEGETEAKAATVVVAASSCSSPSRYETQKRRDWNTFLKYLKSHKPPLSLSRCSGAHVIEFLKQLDRFGRTKIHVATCPFFGVAYPPAQCTCPLRQAWGSLDSLVGRLRAAAFEEIGGGLPESNPLAAKAIRIYLKEVREAQAKARGITHGKKKRSLTAKATTKVDVREGCGGGSGGSALVVSAIVVESKYQILNINN